MHHDCHTPLDRRPSVVSKHWSIARYWPTIVLIAARRRSVHSMRWSQILAENPDFCLPHLHSTPPLGGGVPSKYCHAVWYRKTRMVWLPDGEKKLKIRLFVLTQSTNVTYTPRHTGRHHMTAIRRQLHESSGARHSKLRPAHHCRVPPPGEWRI